MEIPFAFGTLQATFAGNLPQLLTVLRELCSSKQRISYIDTAQIYGPSEEIIGQFMSKYPSPYFRIITKGGIKLDPQEPFHSIEEIPKDLISSLERLRLSSVHCFMIHRLNPSFEISVLAQTLREFKKYYQYLGFSELTRSQLERVISVCRHYSLPFKYLESAFSPFTRRLETNGILDLCRREGITILTYTSVLRGLLKPELMLITEFNLDPLKFRQLVFDKLKIDNPMEQSVGIYDPEFIKTNVKVVQNFMELSYRLNISPTNLSIAYVTAKGCIPIIGTTKPEHLRSNFVGTMIELDPLIVREIEEITATFRGNPNPHSLDYLDV